MALVLDPAIHVDAALFAGMPLNGRLGIHDCELVPVRLDAQVVAPYDGDLREQRPFRFPALGAAAHVIVCALPFDRYLDLVLRAIAQQRPACKVLCRRFQSTIDRRMYLDATHDDSSFGFRTWTKRVTTNLAPDDRVQASAAGLGLGFSSGY
jgi:hypothetical protein